jgi:hypothetical protein
MLGIRKKILRWPQILQNGIRYRSHVKNHADLRIGISLRALIFFSLFYIYLRFYVDLRFLYHGGGIITNFPVFYKGLPFFKTFLSYPGGLVEYVSAFLSQFFYYSWAGALIVTVQAWLLGACMAYLLKTVNFSRLRGICYILPLFVLISYTRYTYFFTTTTALLAALIFAFLYFKVSLSRINPAGQTGIFLLLSVGLYYLAGGAFLLFAVICTVYELLFRNRWKTGLFYLLTAAVLPYVMGLIIFRVSVVNAYSDLLPFSWKILYYETRRRGVIFIYCLFLIPPVILLILGLWQLLLKRLRRLKEQSNTKTDKKRQVKSPNLIVRIFNWYRRSSKFRWIVETSLLLIVTGTAVFVSRKENLRTLLKVDYYAYHRMWPELIEAARNDPTNPLVVHSVNKALYNTNRLGYEMFSWPQDPDYLFLSNPAYRWHYWRNFDAYLDIGLVNMAENDLTECLEGLGDRPMILQRLVLINIVKANFDSARVYLNTLDKTLFYSKWAGKYLKLLETDPNCSTDKYIQHLRSISLDKDYCTQTIPTHTMLALLLEKNSRNRMAFEYLMACYMLERHLGNLIQNINRLKDFGYSQVPTHFEEACLTYVAGTGQRIRISGYRPSDSLRQRIDDFGRIMHNYGSNKQAAYNELASKYGNTYFFYFLYGTSGTTE